MNNRTLFLQHVAQTSPTPLALEIVSAQGCYLMDAGGRQYLDVIGGISVCHMGHGHPAIVAAVKEQAEQYLHVMVYGEVVQAPQVQYAALLAENLPRPLDSIYFTNSGAEATEGALKLARRVTGRTDVIACNKAYHGHTLGALSVMGDEYWRNAYRPLLPGVWHYDFNSEELVGAINGHTACVIMETVQGEAGVVSPDAAWIQAVRQRCTDMGALLILDEIQCGFGRTGKLWGMEHYGVVPDIVLLGKALGGGMPLGAFAASRELMKELTYNPVLGHITTFGGHPVCCAAGLAGFRAMVVEGVVAQVAAKETLFRSLLVHPAIREVRSAGLLMAVELESAEKVSLTLERCMEAGLFSDWFLFAPHCIRLAPPLTTTEQEIRLACRILLACL